jgi:predicted nucleotidyltransferase
MTQLAQIAREVGVNERTLRRAVNQGTLRAGRPSPRTLDLSLSERRYLRRSWSLLSQLRGALRTERNVCFALLYGSVARGDDTRASDVDLIVDLRDSSLERLLDLRAKLSSALDRPVDLVQLQDAEADPAFLAVAIDDGRVLVDREGRWPRLRRCQGALRRRGSARDEARKRSALAGIDRFLAARG